METLPDPAVLIESELFRRLHRIGASHDRPALASSLGTEDMVLLDAIARTGAAIDVFVIDTGRLHAETLELLEVARARYGRPIEVFRPLEAQVAAFVRQHGLNGFYDGVAERHLCCGIRKVEPLGRALEGRDAWLTGQRRAQGPERAALPLEETDHDRGIAKHNPLAYWSDDDLRGYIERHDVPVNALHARGYPSIGCEPCTRAVRPGEDPRAGRWWWERGTAKECGLHLPKIVVEQAGAPMSALLAPSATPDTAARFDHLDWLESEAIFILREVAAQCAAPALLFSGGKDSCVLLRLAEKAFRPQRFGFPLLHIDTGHNFPEVIEFRDRRAAELGERLVVRSVDDSIRRGTVRLRGELDSRNAAQSVTLLEAVEELKLDALIGGARRDEEKARAKERVFSFRDSFGQWEPKQQRPECWDLYNARHHPGEHMRVFPISNWTELDVWQYIERERLALPSLYFSHRREVVRRDGLLVPVTPLTPPKAGEAVESAAVRFRTVGDITCTCPVESDAATLEQIIVETAGADVTERGATRMDDQTSDASMERRKREGYFDEG